MRTNFERFVLGILFQMLITIGWAQFTMGPKVSVNFSNIIHETKMKTGFSAGIFFRFGKSFYFQPDFEYSFRSSTLKEAVKELKKNARLKDHYIDIPLLVGYKFVDNPNFNFRVFIGPRLGVLIANNLQSNKKDKIIGTVQVGGRTGLGIDFWRFTLDVSYDFSANKYNAASVTWRKQNMINIAFGFKIFKGKNK
ncbi:MAG: PorT family protein [Bacteroidales bacterium]|jgi:hypothetical protein|nr:PorT family protein [Bacteroidales bacterium]